MGDRLGMDEKDILKRENFELMDIKINTLTRLDVL